MLLLGVLILLPLTQLWLVHHVRRRLSISLSLAQTEMGRGTSQNYTAPCKTKPFSIELLSCDTGFTAGCNERNRAVRIAAALAGKFCCNGFFQFAAMHCGKLRISVKKCRIADYFHLFSCSVRKCTAAEGIVVPSEQAESLCMPYLQRSEMEDSVNYDPNRPGDDNTELFGIREFRDTDNRNGFTGNAAAEKKHYLSRNTADRWRNNVPSGSTGHKPKPCKSRVQKWMPRWRQPMPLPVF